jgi:hypothetical protein
MWNDRVDALALKEMDDDVAKERGWLFAERRGLIVVKALLIDVMTPGGAMGAIQNR